MVVIHNYSAGKNQLVAPSSDSSSGDNIDEERAYVVGIWVVSIIAAIIVILFVLFAVARTSEDEQEKVAGKEESEEQVLGEKKEPVKEETKTEIKEEPTKDVQDLERPLSEEEMVAKAEKIPGSQIHTVAVGESLYTIGTKYNISWQEIAKVSNLSPPYNLRVGQKIIIPPKGGTSEE